MGPPPPLVVHGAREHNLKGRHRLPAPEQADLHHRIVRFGQVQPGLRHDLRGGPAPLRRVPLGYARSSSDDGEARRGLDRRPLASISIDQKTTSRNPRSTVGTVTEIYDYLRLALRARRAPALPGLRPPIAGQSLESIVDQILALPEGTRFNGERARRARPQGRVPRAARRAAPRGLHARQGRRREQKLLEDEIPLDKKFKHSIEVVVDRLVLKPDLRTRLWQSWRRPRSSAEAVIDRDRPRRRGAKADVLAELRVSRARRVAAGAPAAIFSFNSTPHGACPRCTGLGSQQEIDPDLLVPDGSVSITDGALVPWAVGNSSFYESVINAIAERYEIATSRRRGTNLSDEHRKPLPLRDGRRRVYIQYRTGWAGAARTCSRSRARPEPRAALQGDRLVAAAGADRGVHVVSPRAGCHGARLKPEGSRSTVASSRSTSSRSSR